MKWRSIARGAASVLLLLAVLLVGGLIAGDLPEPGQELDDPFVRHGQLGETIHLRSATVRVTEVELGQYAGDRTTGYAAAGLWVKATIEFTPTTGSALLAVKRWVSADGSLSWNAARGDMTCPRTPPGVTAQCDALIDVPEERLLGGTLLLRVPSDDDRFDDQAMIDVGITAAQIAEGAQRTEFLSVGTNTVVDPASSDDATTDQPSTGEPTGNATTGTSP